jgi:hypothetical protein
MSRPICTKMIRRRPPDFLAESNAGTRPDAMAAASYPRIVRVRWLVVEAEDTPHLSRWRGRWTRANWSVRTASKNGPFAGCLRSKLVRLKRPMTPMLQYPCVLPGLCTTSQGPFEKRQSRMSFDRVGGPRERLAYNPCLPPAQR